MKPKGARAQLQGARVILLRPANWAAHQLWLLGDIGSNAPGFPVI